MGVDKKVIAEEVINMLQPSIQKALAQTPIEHREDLKQELYERIIRKIAKEDINELPNFFEIIENSKEEYK